MKSLKHTWLLAMIFCCLVNEIVAQTPCQFNANVNPDYNCFSGVGEATVTMQVPGTPPFTLTSTPPGINGISATNTFTATNLLAFDYTIHITDANGCKAYTEAHYLNPTNSINLVTSSTIACNGGTNGSASALYNMGPGPFTYTWSNGGNTPAINGIAPGVYTVSATNSKNCTATTTVNVGEAAPINTVFNNTMITCFGGTLSSAFTTTGGTSPYTYTVNGNPAIGGTATNLSAGVQTILIKDSKGCLKTTTGQINQGPQLIIGNLVTPPTCPGKSNGVIEINLFGSTSGYTFAWQPGTSTTPTLSGILPGNYTVTVTQPNACVTKSVITVNPASAIVAPPPQIKKENCSAADGAFTLNVSGGTAPYSYTTIPGNSGSNMLAGLSTGGYTTIVEDAKGCIDSVKFFIGNLSTVSVSAIVVNTIKCYNNCNGSVLLNVQNAAHPVTYSATGTPTTLSNVISNLCAGLIVIKAIDAVGCPAFDTINFPVPPVFTYSAASPPLVCYGKQVTLKAFALGGTGAHTYIWNPGALQGPTVTTVPNGTSVYALNVYDANGCTLAPYHVTVNVNPQISAEVSEANTGICPGTTAQITPTISGGDGNYTYTWLPGGTKEAFIFVENITIPTYSLIVNDGCGSPTLTKQIDIKLHPVIKPTFVSKGDSACAPLCIKFINTTPGSKDPIWNYGDKPFEQTGDTTEYCYQNAGNYNVRLTVTDINSCKTSFTYPGAIHVMGKPYTNFVSDPEIVTLNNADNVLLENLSSSASSFKWYAGEKFLSTQKDTRYTFQDTGCYDFKLIVSNKNCIDSIQKTICVFEGFNLYMPNAFSPNNDGLNDVLKPKGTGWLFDNYLFEVYNRWGFKVFKTNNVYEGWDGGFKQLDPYDQDLTKANMNDVYIWRVVVTDNFKNEHIFKGSVTLVR